MNRSFAVALATVAAIVVVVVILATGGPSDAPPGADATGDVATEGEGVPEAGDLADIANARVSRRGNEIVFTATMVEPIPERVGDGRLEFRWDGSVDGSFTWIISAAIARDVSAAVTSVEGSYGASTVDETLPGDVTVEGDTLTITLAPLQIDGFPGSFEWRLQTTFDGDAGDPNSAVARDAAPDGGLGTVEDD